MSVRMLRPLMRPHRKTLETYKSERARFLRRHARSLLKLAASSEAKPPLKFYHPARERPLCAAKVGILNLRADGVEAERLQVQNVEDVKEVGFEFKGSSFTEKTRHPESLGQAHINITIFRAAE